MDFGRIVFDGWSFLWAYSWFPLLCGFVIECLALFYSWFPNYGVAIILLTLLFKIATLPLTYKSTKSMEKMKEVMPEVNKIREKYKGDPMVMNKKVMAFYKQRGVSPFPIGGCLPMILNMPILFSLFVALRKAIELRG